MSTPARNAPCPCGSGRKYKQCCLGKQAALDQDGEIAEVSIEGIIHAAREHLAAGRARQAHDICTQILAGVPDYLPALNILGLAASQLGRPDQGVAHIMQALRLQPANATLHANLGAVLSRADRPAQALLAFQTALRLQPQTLEFLQGIGDQLLALGDVDDAVQAYQELLAVRPKHYPAHANLAVALMRLGRLEEAESHAREADRLAPTTAAPLLTLSSLMAMRGRLHIAVQVLEQALLRNPGYGEAHLELGRLLLQLGEHATAALHLLQFLDMGPDRAGPATEALLLLLSDPGMDASRWLEIHVRWHALFSGNGPLPPRPQPRSGADAASLRLACLLPDPDSADARHRVLPLLQALGAHLQVHIYTAAPVSGATPDGMHWHDLDGLDAAGVSARLREDGIDVVLDVLGHLGQGSRSAAGLMPVLLHRPAPLMLTMGYPGSLGITGLFDALIGDQVLCGKGTREEYVEALELLQGGAMLWRQTPPEAGQRVAHGGPPAFCCFQGPEGIDPAFVRLWCRILEARSDAYLILSHPAWEMDEAREALIGHVRSLGLEPSRLGFSRQSPEAVLAESDVLLDAPGFSAGTGLATALYAGVPAVTLSGSLHRARTGAAVLHAAGRGAWVASDADDYVRIALELVDDRQELERLRQEMPDQLADTALADAKGMAVQIHGIIQRLWRDLGTKAA